MGGWGSGPYGPLGYKTAKTRTEHCRSIDIRRWQREKLLHRSFAWQWLNDEGEKAASIGVYGRKDSMLLKYEADGTPIEIEIPLDVTPNGYGWREWFRCPGCGRRCAVLYLKGKFFSCRICHKLNYKSSQVEGDKMAEIDHKLNKIVRRMGGQYYEVDMFPPPKPKGVHQSTYDSLLFQFQWLLIKRDEAWLAGLRAITGRYR